MRHVNGFTRPPQQGQGKRMPADARRRSILCAARQAFIETGNVNGTTVRAIAAHAGISDGVIYRHFPSKDQLFVEAVVEPLREAVDELVAAAEVVDRDEPLTPDRQLETLQGLYRRLSSTLTEILPLLGLVLFGDPKVAKRFYRDYFSVAMDRLGAAWQLVEDRYGVQTPVRDISARAVMGMALTLAMESHHTELDHERALVTMASGTIHGFFPQVKTPRPFTPQ